MNRRNFTGAVLSGSLAALPLSAAASPPPRKNSVRIGFNLSTLREFRLPLLKELEIVHQGGFRSVELWIDKVRKYLAEGGSLAELNRFLSDHDLKVENMIGFVCWIHKEEKERQKGLDLMKSDMELTARLGGRCIAACAAGARNEEIKDLDFLAQCYRDVCKAGLSTGVRPLLELWGSSKLLSRLSVVLAIASGSEMENAGLLLDAYHLYRGGNSFSGLNLIAGSAMPVFHLNDYPASPAREELKDKDRVFPGDGICPLKKILDDLFRNGFNGVFSLELFNLDYCRTMRPEEIVRTGYQKMQKTVFF